VIGEDTEFTGQLTGDGHVLVKGSVNGDSDLMGPVTIAPAGRWKGRLRAADVIIAGTVDGDIEASGKAEIRPTARVTGSVAAAQIAIGEGARVDGKLSTLSAEEIKKFAEKRATDD
jgi:cytoskeletal protein CcmA (bactofilin family)